MKRKVYRSLDMPTSFFGIRGRYAGVMAYSLVPNSVLSIGVSSLLGMIAGFVFFLGCAAACYAAIRSLQSRIDEKDFPKFLRKRLYPRVILTSSSHIRNLWKGL